MSIARQIVNKPKFRLKKPKQQDPHGIGHNAAPDQLRHFTDRILSLKADQDDIGADVRSAYDEAKTAGYDKTVLGKLVTYLRKRGKDSAAVIEADALFDVYLMSYDGALLAGARLAESLQPSRAHAHAREAAPKITEVGVVAEAFAKSTVAGPVPNESPGDHPKPKPVIPDIPESLRRQQTDHAA